MFVDIHNHILPGIDDGSPDMAYALDMARLAVLDGTDTTVATPHRAWEGRRDAPADWVVERVRELQIEIDRASVPLRVVPGVEIQIVPGVANDLTARTLLTLGGSGKWALIEPPFDQIQPDALEQLQAILDSGHSIVLAHPERNRVIQQDLAFVEACAALGINFQLTTGSILGKFGDRARRTAEAILRRAPDWKIVIASDTHDNVRRPPNWMRAARDKAADIVGIQAAQEMVDARPRSMIAG